MFLIVGGDLEIGGAAFAALKMQGQPTASTTRRRDHVAQDRLLLDLAASLDAWEPPQEVASACLCAAVARLADCAADPHRTAQINVTQTLALVDKLLKRDIYVLFLSTNQVFDGSVPQVRPDAPHSPVSEYGRQKAELNRPSAITSRAAHPSVYCGLRRWFHRACRSCSGGSPIWPRGNQSAPLPT